MFHRLAFFFQCDNRSRGIIRQNFDEAACLWEAVQNTRGNILEIGRRLGGSTYLLISAANGRHVTSIDIAPLHHPRIAKTLAYWEKQGAVTLVVGDSRTYASGPLGLLFIDGDHSFPGCSADVVAHWAQLHPVESHKALAVFHDAVPNNGRAYENSSNHDPAVTEVCARIIECGAGILVKTVGSMLVMEKLKELPSDLFDSKTVREDISF